MSEAKTLQVTALPFSVPHFLEDGSLSFSEFPCKWDFIIADVDKDGEVSELDRTEWTNKWKIAQHMDSLRITSEDGKTDLEIWEQDWWEEGLRVYMILDDKETTLTWNDNWQLNLELPPQYIELEVQLLYLGLNQNRFQNILEETDKLITRIETDLDENTMELFKQTPTWQNLKERLDHVYRTYVRL